MQRCPTISVSSVSVFGDELDHFFETTVFKPDNGAMQCGEAPLLKKVIAWKEYRKHIGFLCGRSEMEDVSPGDLNGGSSSVIFPFGVGACIQKQLTDLDDGMLA